MYINVASRTAFEILSCETFEVAANMATNTRNSRVFSVKRVMGFRVIEIRHRGGPDFHRLPIDGQMTVRAFVSESAFVVLILVTIETMFERDTLEFDVLVLSCNRLRVPKRRMTSRTLDVLMLAHKLKASHRVGEGILFPIARVVTRVARALELSSVLVIVTVSALRFQS